MENLIKLISKTAPFLIAIYFLSDSIPFIQDLDINEIISNLIGGATGNSLD